MSFLRPRQHFRQRNSGRLTVAPASATRTDRRSAIRAQRTDIGQPVRSFPVEGRASNPGSSRKSPEGRGIAGCSSWCRCRRMKHRCVISRIDIKRRKPRDASWCRCRQGQTFFFRGGVAHVHLHQVHQVHPKFTRAARSGDAPGNSGSWRGRAHCRKGVGDPPTPSRSTTPRHCQQFYGHVVKVLNRIESCDHHRNGTGSRSARPGLPEQFKGAGQRHADSSSAGISQEIKKPAQWPAMLGGVG